MFRLGFILSCLLWCFIAFAQEPYAIRLAPDDSFPAKAIFDLFVDANGQLHLATDKGLYRYDGVNYHAYRMNQQLAWSITDVRQDYSGRLWCRNFANQIFYTDDEKILQPFPYLEYILDKNKGNIVGFHIEADTIWIITEKALFKARGLFAPPQMLFSLDTKDKPQIFTALMYHKEEEAVYAGTTSSIIRYKPDEDVRVYDTRDGQKELILFEDEVFYLIKGVRNELWSLKNKQVTTDIKPEGTYFYRLVKLDNKLWLCTSNGLFEVDVSKMRLHKQWFSEERITSFVKDLEGNSWAGTLDEGLLFITQFVMLTTNDDCVIKPPFFTRVEIDDKGHIFAGTNKGKVYEFSPDHALIRIYDVMTETEIEHLFLSGDTIFTSAGIFKKGHSELVFKSYFGKGLARDSRGNVLMASYNSAGLMAENLKGPPLVPDFMNMGNLVNFGDRNLQFYTLRSVRAHSVHYCRSMDSYFVGYSDGLYYYNSKYQEKEIRTKEGESIVALRMEKDLEGCIWVASSQQGLLRIQDGRVVEQFTTDDGLSGNYCRRLAMDSNGIWILTDKGLDYLDFDSQKIEYRGIHLSLQGLVINDLVFKDNTLWLATNKGLIYVLSDKLMEVWIPQFDIQDVLVNNVSSKTTQKFSSVENNFEFFLNAIHYRSLGHFTYEYRLLGLEDYWYAQSSRISNVHYLSLKPGKYVFEARARVGDVVSNTESFPFVINQPFYFQGWFLVLGAVVFLILLYLLYLYVVKRTQKKQAVLQKLTFSQLTALRAQMNPHFMFNILTAVQGLIYSDQKAKANEYLGNFSDLMRRILDVSDKIEVSIQQEIDTIKLYIALEQSRFEDKDFMYDIHLPKEEDLENYFIPSLVIQPYVENAIKHGLLHKRGEKYLKIDVVKHSFDYWLFIIQDNGIGRKASSVINNKLKKHQSFATKANENRIKLINKISTKPISIIYEDMTNSNNEPLGTRVSIWLPIKK